MCGSRSCSSTSGDPTKRSSNTRRRSRRSPSNRPRSRRSRVCSRWVAVIGISSRSTTAPSRSRDGTSTRSRTSSRSRRSTRTSWASTRRRLRCIAGCSRSTPNISGPSTRCSGRPSARARPRSSSKPSIGRSHSRKRPVIAFRYCTAQASCSNTDWRTGTARSIATVQSSPSTRGTCPRSPAWGVSITRPVGGMTCAISTSASCFSTRTPTRPSHYFSARESSAVSGSAKTRTRAATIAGYWRSTRRMGPLGKRSPTPSRRPRVGPRSPVCTKTSSRRCGIPPSARGCSLESASCAKSD